MDSNVIIFMGVILVIIFSAMYAGYQIGKKAGKENVQQDSIFPVFPKKTEAPLREVDLYEDLRVDASDKTQVIQTLPGEDR